jgi:flavin prenyltransferase
MESHPLIVGISGASGAIYGVRLLEVLKGKIATHLIVSKSAALTLKKELDLSVEQVP